MGQILTLVLGLVAGFFRLPAFSHPHYRLELSSIAFASPSPYEIRNKVGSRFSPCPCQQGRSTVPQLVRGRTSSSILMTSGPTIPPAAGVKGWGKLNLLNTNKSF